ncbi:Fe-S cluster assembly protein NifU [bacterium]|nr:MAG: Fe-S cluster assembly protein NifU [bacterium]
MWNYSDKVFDHFMNPRNVGEVESPDGVGEVGSMACGDALRLSFRLGDDGRIADARFQTFGCGSAIASSSVLTEMVKGLTLEEAAKITNEQIAGELDGLPREKMHCSVMGREALEAAMIDYYKRQGRNVPCGLLQESTELCHCYQVSRETVREAIMTHRLTEIEDVTHHTKAGGGCGECHHDIGDLIRDCQDKWEREDAASGGLQELAELPAAAVPVAAADDREGRIREVLVTDIAPALRNDGGDIELVRCHNERVYVRLTGNCAACKASEATIKGFVEAQLREFVDETIQVIEVD